MEVYCPTLALAECAAAVARQTNDPALAKELISIIEDFPGRNLISLAFSKAGYIPQSNFQFSIP